MQRFMLVSLVSCMLVGQVSCDPHADAAAAKVQDVTTNFNEFCYGIGSVAGRHIELFPSVTIPTFCIGALLGVPAFSEYHNTFELAVRGGFALATLSTLAAAFVSNVWCAIGDTDCLLRCETPEACRGKTRSFMRGRIIANLAGIAGCYKFLEWFGRK